MITDFISLPGDPEADASSNVIPPGAIGLKKRSQSLMGKVRRGTLFRTRLASTRRRTESFDLVQGIAIY